MAAETCVFGIFNQKGGVAKTTSSVTLAHGLALLGQRVLLVDLDAQGNVANSLGLGKRGGVYELLFGDAGRAITPSGRARLDVVLSDHTTAEARERLTGVAFRERVLAARLRGINSGQAPTPPTEAVGCPSPAAKTRGRGEYDVVVIDTAPGVDLLQVSALVACTHFVIPVALAHLAIVGAGDLLGTVASLRDLGGFGGRFLGILPTLWEQRTRESASQLEALRGQFGQAVWPPVPQDAKANEATRAGETLWEYAPRCRALMGADVRQNDDADTVRLEGGYGRVLRRLVQELGLRVEVNGGRVG